MKVYRTTNGILIEHGSQYHLLKEENWDAFINDDQLYAKAERLVNTLAVSSEGPKAEDLLVPVVSQELWACGVTYLRSKVGRQEESKASGGSDFYARVYDAERPEVFFKSTPHRISGPGGDVRIRKDSVWDVPEPELTLVVTSSGKIVGYTIGNDMSSRSIEGENPLYLPQAKTYDGCAAIGPCILVTQTDLPIDTRISLSIEREMKIVFEGDVLLNQMKRTPKELAGFVFRECTFPEGCLIMTGTGIVPGNDFTLKSGDIITISIDGIGTLTNTVR